MSCSKIQNIQSNCLCHFKKTGPRYVVQIGDKIIDYNEEFRLFLSTRNPNPFIPPDAASIVTEVNFTTTRSGLRGQVYIGNHHFILEIFCSFVYH